MQELLASFAWLLETPAAAPARGAAQVASAAAAVAALEHARSGHKGILAESGWAYLINDTNQYLGYLYGARQWDPAQRERAVVTLTERRERLAASGAPYLKFIVPEKAVVYPEHLPAALQGLPHCTTRPALQVAKSLPGFVSYCGDCLTVAKPYGPLYFRGDSHPNWLGSYFIYRDIIAGLRSAGAAVGPTIPGRDLKASIYTFDGDVCTQLAPQDAARLAERSDLQFAGSFECGVRYELDAAKRRSKTLQPTGVLAGLDFSRELIVTEVDDPSLPSAVIFRDSTCDRMVTLLAEHFRRAVFVWHQGEVIGDVLDAERPDLVVHIMAERFVVSYGKNMVPISTMPRRPAG